MAELCWKLRITEGTLYRWRKRYGGLGVPVLRKLRTLWDEDSMRKRLVADPGVDKAILLGAVRRPR